MTGISFILKTVITNSNTVIKHIMLPILTIITSDIFVLIIREKTILANQTKNECIIYIIRS